MYNHLLTDEQRTFCREILIPACEDQIQYRGSLLSLLRVALSELADSKGLAWPGRRA